MANDEKNNNDDISHADISLKKKPSVFISYARADATDFAQKLHDDIEVCGIDAWLDKRDIKDGITFIEAIDIAIQSCDYFILVFTPGANKSEFCRSEWEVALKYYKPIIPLLYRGDYKDLPKEAFVYLNNAPDFRNKELYADELKKLVKNISDFPSLPGETRNISKISDYSPRPELIKILQEALTSHKTTINKRINNIGVGIYGMGGVGKSTLATVLADEYFIRRTFKDGIFWLTIGTDPQLKEIWNQLANYLGHPRHDFKNAEDANAFFELYTKDKECLIILDDLWTKEHADAFLNLGKKSRIFATSRRADILDALELYNYPIDEMSDTEAQDLLRRVTKLDSLPQIANYVIKACGHLPLALEMVGKMIAEGDNQESRWEDANQRLRHRLEEIEGKPYRDDMSPNLRSALQISIDDLDDDLRDAYLTFAIFPNDTLIPENVLLTFWHTLEKDKIRRRIDKLVSRSLLKRVKGSLSLHDLQISYLHSEVQDRLKELHHKLLNAYREKSNGQWHKVPDDGYFYNYLIYHLEQAECHKEIHALFQNEGWASKRPLHKLLQDFDYAKKLVPASDITNHLRYAIFEETLYNRYPKMPIEIASQLVIRNLVSPELMVSAIHGMSGDTKDKVNTYITVINQLNDDSTREKLALDALILTKNVSETEDRASLILELLTYLGKSNRQNNYRLLWQTAFEISAWQQRESLLVGILPNLSDAQIIELKNDLYASNVSARLYVYIFEEIKPYLNNPKIIDEIGSFVLDKVVNAQTYERVYLLDYLIKHLPESLQKKAQKNIVPAYLACVIWEPDDFSIGSKSCFETLVKWIPIEDLPILWERASEDAAKKDAGLSWRAEKVQLAIAKYWGAIDYHSYQHITGRNDIPDFVQSIDIANLGDDHKVSWCEAKIKRISLLPKAEQEKEWLIVCDVAIGLAWAEGGNAQLFERKRKWLDEFILPIPMNLVPKIWEKTLKTFEERLSKKESEKYGWGSGSNLIYYAAALASLATRIPDEQLADYIQSTILFWIKYHDYTSEWSITIARMLNRLDDIEREKQWEQLAKIALGDLGKKPYVHSGLDFLFSIVGASNNSTWQDKKIEWLLETTRAQSENISWRLLYNFNDLPAKVKPHVWLEAAQKLEERDSSSYIFQCFEQIYPKILEDIPNFIDQINWDISIWGKSIVGGRDFGGYTGFNYLLRHAPHDFRVEAYQLIKSKGKDLTNEDNIRFLEFMVEEDKQKVLHQLVNIWSEEEIKNLTPVAVSNWTPQTVWRVWQYMHDLNPERDWPYCNWALTLAPHIPAEHIYQAYIMALQNLGWPLWRNTCQVLATKMPHAFADNEWDRLTEVINNAPYSYEIKNIRSALTTSLSDKKLEVILEDHRKQTQLGYKQLTEYALIDGNLFHYFQSMFLVSASARIHELSDFKHENSFWKFIIEFHKKFNNIVKWGAFIYGGLLAFTFPIMLPIIRFLRPIDNLLCLSYVFYIAISLEKVGRFGYGRNDINNDYFQSHTTLSMHLYKYIDRKTSDLDISNRNLIKAYLYLAPLMLSILLLLFEQRIIFRILMLVGVLIGIVLFPLVWLLRIFLTIVFMSYYTTNQFFEQALKAHLCFSNSKVAYKHLDQWITQSKAPDILEYRPLLNKIGGKKLRKAVSIAYKNANTWWYDAVTVVEDPQKVSI